MRSKFLCPLLKNIRTPVGMGTSRSIGNKQILAVPYFSIQGLQDGYHKILDIKKFMEPLSSSLFISQEECEAQPIFRRIVVSQLISDKDGFYLRNIFRQEKQTLLYNEFIKKADGIISPVSNPFKKCLARIKIPVYKKQSPEIQSVYYLKLPTTNDLYIVYESSYKNISLSEYKSLTKKDLVLSKENLKKDFNKFSRTEKEIIADILFRK